jgi:hypothetical protein
MVDGLSTAVRVYSDDDHYLLMHLPVVENLTLYLCL